MLDKKATLASWGHSPFAPSKSACEGGMSGYRKNREGGTSEGNMSRGEISYTRPCNVSTPWPLVIHNECVMRNETKETGKKRLE